MENKELFKAIEAMMYVQGEMGVSIQNIKDVFEIPLNDVRKSMKEFVEWFKSKESGLEILEFNENFSFVTKKDYKEFITKLVAIEKKQKLSNASLEVVGIIAYNQPITRSKINEIRGVVSDHIVQVLLVKGLIEERGIQETPGNPILYGLSDKFFNYFQLKSLKDLPKLAEVSKVASTEEGFDLFTSQREE